MASLLTHHSTLNSLTTYNSPLITQLAIISGSGIAHALAPYPVLDEIDYRDLPNMPIPAVGSHVGVLRTLEIVGTRVLVFCGRIHAYEGYSNDELLQLVRTAHSLNIQGLIVTNAAGGLNLGLQTGDIVALHNAVENHSTSKEWHNRWLKGAWARNTKLLEGSYVQVLGPSYETRAEIGMYRAMGYDVIGMSTMNEVAAAQKLGIATVGCSLVTNQLSPFEQRVLDHSDVVDAATYAADRLRLVIETAVSTCVLA